MKGKLFYVGLSVLAAALFFSAVPKQALATGFDAGNINIYNSKRVTDPGKKDYKTLIESLGSGVLAFISFAAGAVVIIMLGYGAILYITAGGNEANTDKAKRVLLYAIVGFMVVSLSFILRQLTIDQTNQALNTSSSNTEKEITK